MNNQDLSYFIYGMFGVCCGLILRKLAEMLISNARKASEAGNACNQNCNQGRCCNCKEKK